MEKKTDEDFASIFRTTESERWIPGKGHHHLSVDVLVRGGKLPLSKTPMFLLETKWMGGKKVYESLKEPSFCEGLLLFIFWLMCC